MIYEGPVCWCCERPQPVGGPRRLPESLGKRYQDRVRHTAYPLGAASGRSTEYVQQSEHDMESAHDLKVSLPTLAE